MYTTLKTYDSKVLKEKDRIKKLIALYIKGKKSLFEFLNKTTPTTKENFAKILCYSNYPLEIEANYQKTV